MSKCASAHKSHSHIEVPRRSRLAPQLRDWPAEELTRIRIVLRKLTALRVDNPEDAEDLVQETLLTMTKKCPEIELQKGLLIWGMGILRKKIGNYYRRGQRYSSWQSLDHDVSQLAQPPPSAESAIHYAELRALVDAIVEGFSAPERAVMDLLLEGLPTNEIAELLSPERYQNIVNRAHRGRKRLSNELAKYGYRILRTRPEKRGRKVTGFSAPR